MKSVGRGTRLAIGLSVGLALVLTAVIGVITLELTDLWYLRLDLTKSRRNTVDSSLLEVVDNLPEKVTVDVFFRPLASPYDAISSEAQGRMLQYLTVVDAARRDELEVNHYPPNELEEAQLRQQELGVEGENLMVFSCANRRTVLYLFSDVVDVDWGNPTLDGVRYLTSRGIPGVVDPRTYRQGQYRPPQLREFRGEEAFARALLKVSAGDPPKVVFTTGHGEPDIEGSLTEDLSACRYALERDGFEVVAWDPLKEPRLPANTAVIAVVGPRQPLAQSTVDQISEYVKSGGRAILAPDPSELELGMEPGVSSLLVPFGMTPQIGVVCQEVVDEAGNKIDGQPQCSILLIDESGMQASSPLTEPLRRRGRRVQFRLSPSLKGGPSAAGGYALALVSSPKDAWRDFLDPAGRPDFIFDHRIGEKRERLGLILLNDLPAALDGGSSVSNGRVLGIATASFLTNGTFASNRDFLLNAFNWMAEREHRMRVSPLEVGESWLELERSQARPILFNLLWLALPGSCLLVGGFLAWRRRTT